MGKMKILTLLTITALLATTANGIGATDLQMGQQSPSSRIDSANQAAQMASESLREAEDNVFSRAHLQAAAERIKQAAVMNPDEPMVYVAWAGLIRVTGFMRGDWHNQTSFEPGVLDKAESLTKKALEMAKAKPLPEAHLMLARVLISKGQFSEAQDHLDQAKATKADVYKYHFIQAALFRRSGALDRSLEEYDLAEKAAVTKVDIARILDNRAQVYGLKDDLKSRENALLKSIQIKPSPQAYGNYGLFLLENGRCSEALIQFETGLKLGSYPLGEKGLAETKACLKSAK